MIYRIFDVIQDQLMIKLILMRLIPRHFQLLIDLPQLMPFDRVILLFR